VTHSPGFVASWRRRGVFDVGAGRRAVEGEQRAHLGQRAKMDVRVVEAGLRSGRLAQRSQFPLCFVLCGGIFFSLYFVFFFFFPVFFLFFFFFFFFFFLFFFFFFFFFSFRARAETFVFVTETRISRQSELRESPRCLRALVRCGRFCKGWKGAFFS